MSQTEKVMLFLKHHEWMTQRDAYPMGIYRLGARIWDLRNKGVPIKAEYVKVTNADGSKTFIARYGLVREEKK